MAALDEVCIRKDDEMLLGATLPEGVQTWTLTIGGTSYQMARGQVRRHCFAAAGDVTVGASWTEGGGPAAGNEGTVHVIAASFGGEQVCHVGTERRWCMTCVGRDVQVDI